MPSPQELLATRLASGEITEEEYDRLIAKLQENEKPNAVEPSAVLTETPTPPPTSPPPIAQPPAPESGISRLAGTLSDGINYFFTGVGIVVLLGIGYAVFLKKDLPKIGDISSKGGRVVFKIVNDTKYSEDLLLWVVQDKIRMCPHKTRVKKGYTHTIRFYCSRMRTGNFVGKVQWASSDKTLSAVSKRIK